ncbi:nucleoside-diphosphate sugar epimerase/dehydratase [candidate division KSB1 bacterium]
MTQYAFRAPSIFSSTCKLSEKQRDGEVYWRSGAREAADRAFYPVNPDSGLEESFNRWYQLSFPDHDDIVRQFQILKNLGMRKHFFTRGDSSSLNELFQHQIDRWIKAGKRRLVFFGAGEHTRNLLQMVDFSRSELVGAVDNDPTSWDKEIEGISILPPTGLADLKPDVIILSSAYHETDMMSQVKSMKQANVEVFSIYSGTFLNFYSWIESGFRLTRWSDMALYLKSIS